MAKRRSKRGKAMGGLLIKIRNGIKVEGEVEKKYVEGILMRTVEMEKMKWRIIEVYVNEDLERKLEELDGRGKGGRKTLIGRDFNARTGDEGREVKGEKEMEERRRCVQRIRK